MAFFTFTQKDAYPVALLVPVIKADEIDQAYFQGRKDIRDDTFIMDLHYSQHKKKTPKSEIKAYIGEVILPALAEAATRYVLVADGEYFKILAGVSQAEANLGYAIDSALGDFKVIYVPNYRTMFYDPEGVSSKIRQGMEALGSLRSNLYQDPGMGIVDFAEYISDPREIKVWLEKLLLWDKPLSADIEAFSLKHYDAGIGTICLCWSKSEGIAFPVDMGPEPWVVRDLLIDFFERFNNKIMWHNIAYDAYVLVYQLFMKNLTDTEGLLYGLEVMLKNWDCTKLISYLATNSCAGNHLGLKAQAQAYAGNYAVDEIKDIRWIPMDKLLEYNLVDGLSTWFTYEKHWDTLVADDQLEVYETIFKPAIVDIIQMQLTGMPVNMERVKEVKGLLKIEQDNALGVLNQSPIVQRFTHQLNERWVDKRNQELKKKRVTLADAKEVFNQNSAPQLQSMLYEMLGLPVIETTKNGQPSTDGDTLKDLKNHTKDPNVLAVLDALLDVSALKAALGTFIPALENARKGPDGWHYLFGNFNLGGTLSGRLSSSEPNLQNIPAGGEGEKTLKGRVGKLIKSCFQAPKGWLFCGLDFASLEDRISALTTKDPNKLKVYTDGYDGHSLRAFFYFRESMPDIVDTVESINSIQDKYKPERQESKAPTFALTYQGTWSTLVNNCGFSREKAELIETRYHQMYEVSDQWVSAQLDKASIDGYVTAAFGLRVRTPLLAQVIRGTSRTPREAEAEGRSAGNALGQSWCLLNNRACSDFMGRVRKSPERLNIRPCAHIHDASYYMIRDRIESIQYTNIHLVKAVQWQEHPLIQHDEVKLGGELSIFHPSWDKEAVIPNGATDEEIFKVFDKHLAKLAA